MKKTAFVMSGVLTMLGVVILSWCELVKAVVPRVLYTITSSFASRYSTLLSEYTPDISGVKTIAVLVIIAGAVLSVILYIRGEKVK